MNSSRYALIVEDLDFWQDALHEVLTDGDYWAWVAPSHEAIANNAELDC